METAAAPAKTYCFADIETDGPEPGRSSMLSLGCVAFDARGEERSSFVRNLLPLDGAVPDPQVMAFWRSQPEAFAAITLGPETPDAVMRDFATWVRSLPRPVVFAAWPMVFDGFWIDWYLRQYGCGELCPPFDRESLFNGTGIDIPSYLRGLLGLPEIFNRSHLPPELLSGVNHTHQPLDDARGHAAVYFNARRLGVRRGTAPHDSCPQVADKHRD